MQRIQKKREEIYRKEYINFISEAITQKKNIMKKF